MKSKFFVAAAVLALCVGATATASAEDLTAAKRAQIKTLLEITNLKAIPEQLANSTIQSWVPGVKQLDPKFPDKGFTIARDAFAATLAAKAPRLAAMAPELLCPCCGGSNVVRAV